MEGFKAKTLDNGTRYLAMHYFCDSDKRGDWGYIESNRIPIREWSQEMEMIQEVYDGEPVYADYIDRFHCHLGRDGTPLPIPVMSGCVYVGGWDAGGTITPAFCLLQIMTQPPFQIHGLLEVISTGSEPMEKFAPRVMAKIQKLLPGTWDEIEHWGDATITIRNGANGETAQQAAKRHGFRIRPASNELEGRLGAVTWALTDRIEGGDPRFVIDGTRCPILREGFQGAYKLDVSTQGDEVGPGRVLKPKPLKNSFSHIHDSAQYAMLLPYKQFGRAKDSTRERTGGPTAQQSAISAILGRNLQ